MDILMNLKSYANALNRVIRRCELSEFSLPCTITDAVRAVGHDLAFFSDDSHSTALVLSTSLSMRS